MRCPFCQSLNVTVSDSRLRDEGTIIWRRRQCLSCNRRFSTKERIDYYPKIYSEIFRIAGKPGIIADLGCGVNPFSFPYMNLKKLNLFLMWSLG